MPTIRLTIPRPHPDQARVLAEKSRFNVLCMGRRWGKSTLGGNLVIPIAVERALPFGWFAPTYLLLDEAYRNLRTMLAPIVTRSVSAPAPKIELITGGVIDFWTLDDPKTVARGRKYAAVAIDEAAMARYLEEAWQQAIRPTLTDYKGEAWFMSTPKGGNYFKRLFDEAATTPGWARWQMPTTSNPYIDSDEVESARLELPSLVFRQEYLAEFIDAEGARVSRAWIKYGEPVDINKCKVVMGVDLAISEKTGADYTCCATIARDPDGRIYVLDVQRVRASFAQVLEFIKSQARKWSPAIIGIEQVQYQAAVVQELLRTTTLPVRGIRPDKDKVTRFQPLEARYEQGLIYHADGLPRCFEDELLSFPMGEHDDQVDAMSTAWKAIDQPSGKWGVF